MLLVEIMMDQLVNHFEAMNDKIMFQNKPTKLANSTWYCTGISQKFIVVAKGQIFQLFSKVYHIFYLNAFTPLSNDFISRSTTIWFKVKNPLKRIGAKANWSNSIDPKTLTAFELAGKRTVCTLGSNLQYHIWRQGAIYANPITKKSIFLFQLNGLSSNTKIEDKILNWVRASPKLNSAPLVVVLVVRGYF